MVQEIALAQEIKIFSSHQQLSRGNMVAFAYRVYSSKTVPYLQTLRVVKDYRPVGDGLWIYGLLRKFCGPN